MKTLLSTLCSLLLLATFVLASFALPPAALAQDASRAREMEAMKKKLADMEAQNAARAREALKRRDLKGQAMSQGEPEGLSPEQKQMYDELMQQIELLKQNIKKRDEALEQLMPGITK